MKSRFADPAEDELAEAVEYYQGLVHGLGDRLASEVKNAVYLIETFPEGSEDVGEGIRRKILPEFPYSLQQTS